MKDKRQQLTKTIIAGANYPFPGEKRFFALWDAAVPGFGLRIYPSGRKAFVVIYRHEGRQRMMNVGRYGVLTVQQARQMAREVLVRVAQGEDPAAERREAVKAPTVADLWQRYLRDHANPKKKPRTVREDVRKWELEIEPALGRLKVAAVNRSDITSLHAALQSKPVQANRILALLSSMFTLAERWGYRPEGSNPCRHVQRYKEGKRERYLSTAEVVRLGDALTEAEQAGDVPPEAIAAVRLLMLTGCRKSEILTLKWEHVDYERRLLLLPDSKTGAKAVPLGAAPLRLLSSLPHLDGNPYVLPGRFGQGHLVGLHRPWDQIRRRAGLEEVRLHDLRHSFASTGAGIGLSLPIIGKLLGHTQAATTQRYAHLAADPLHEAADRISEQLAGTMAGQSAEIIPLDPDQRFRQAGNF